MTPTNDQTTVDVWFDHVLETWFVNHRPSGPAGSNALQVTGTTLVTDVAQPNIPLAAAIERDSAGRPPSNALDLVGLLFGREVAALLEGEAAGHATFAPPVTGADDARRKELLKVIALAGMPDGPPLIALGEIARHESAVRSLDYVPTARAAAAVLRALPACSGIGLDEEHPARRALADLVNWVGDLAPDEDLGAIGAELFDPSSSTEAFDFETIEDLDLASTGLALATQPAAPRASRKSDPSNDVTVYGEKGDATVRSLVPCVTPVESETAVRGHELEVALRSPVIPAADRCWWLYVTDDTGTCTYQQALDRESWRSQPASDGYDWRGTVFLAEARNTVTVSAVRWSDPNVQIEEEAAARATRKGREASDRLQAIFCGPVGRSPAALMGTASAFRDCANQWQVQGDVDRQALALARAVLCYEQVDPKQPGGRPAPLFAQELRAEISGLERQLDWAGPFLWEWDPEFCTAKETRILQPIIRDWAERWLDDCLTGKSFEGLAPEDLLKRIVVAADAADDDGIVNRKRRFLANVALAELGLELGHVAVAWECRDAANADPSDIELLSCDEFVRTSNVLERVHAASSERR